MEMPLGGFCSVHMDANGSSPARAPKAETHYVKIPHAAACGRRRTDGWKLDPLHDRYCGEIHRCGLLLRRNMATTCSAFRSASSARGAKPRRKRWTEPRSAERLFDIDLTEEGISASRSTVRWSQCHAQSVAGYTVRGFLWYQGESNVGRYMDYAAGRYGIAVARIVGAGRPAALLRRDRSLLMVRQRKSPTCAKRSVGRRS